MKFIGQHIVDLIARFRSLIYLENLGSSSDEEFLVVDSDGKVTKNTSTISTIRTNITDNTTNISSNDTDISTNATNIATNTSNIATNSSDIAALQSSSGSSPAIIDNSGTPTLASGITAAEVRSTIGVDAAGTDNSTNVTLAGSLDYITLSGQEITRNAIDLAADVTGTLAVGNGGTGLTSISTLLNSNTTKSDVGLGNVENTALSTYTGNGGALDNQYIANGAGYTTNTGDITKITLSDGSSTTDIASGDATVQFLTGEGIDVAINALSGTVKQVTYSAEDASATNKGVVELATTAEADTGTDTARAVTPAGLKSHVDARFAYQYISFTGSATVPSDGDWMTLSANGISNHTWNTNLGSGGTTVGSSTVTIPTGAICQGIIVPYDCTLVGYASLIRSVGNHQSKVGLAVGAVTIRSAKSKNLLPAN